MKRVLIALILCAMVGLSGCAGIRQNIVKLSVSDKKNIEAVKEAARNIMETWPTYSGLINGYFKDDFEKMPVSFQDAVLKLDMMACRYYPEKYPVSVSKSLGCENTKHSGPSDFELGYSLSLRILMLRDAVKEMIDTFAPDLLIHLPKLLL
jgi:hypothetical protein